MMLNTRALISAPTREATKAWSATLEALGSRTEQVAGLPSALPAVDLVVAQLTGDERIGAFAPARAILVQPKPDLAVSVRLASQRGVGAVMAADYVDTRLLTYAASKLLKGDIFGINKVLPWGAQILSLLVGSHEERLQALSAIDQFCKALGLRGRHLDAIQLVSDELLMNALYDAPAAASGGGQAELAPKDRAGAQLDRPVILQIGSDGRRVAVGVRDSYGSLTRETVLATLERCLTQGGQIERKTSGAGLGMYMVANNVTELVVNLLPGTATEMICVFAVDAPGQQLKHFGIYDESFPRAVEAAGSSRAKGPARAAAGHRAQAPAWQWGALAGAVLLVLSTIFLAVWPYLSRPGRGTIRVNVSPAGATVYLNGVRRGVASPSLEIPELDVSGSYVISARHPGYEPLEEAVALTSGRVQDVQLALRQKKARARLISTPPGAEISLDGKQTGLHTPALVDTLEPGRRTEVRLALYGYITSVGEIVPSADETLRYQTALIVAPEFGSVSLSSDPPGARLIVNDVDTGLVTPIKAHLLKGGQSYRLELRAANRVPWEEAIEPKAGEKLERQVILPPGESLAVQANLPGRVTVDGITKPLPFERVVPVGNHRVRLRGERPYVDHSWVVNVKAGGKVTQRLEFGFVAAPKNMRIKIDRQQVPRVALLAGEHKITVVDPKSGNSHQVTAKVAAGEETQVE